MSSTSARGSFGKGNGFLIKAVRILASVAMLILANALDLSTFISVILSIAAALTAGFDLVLNAIESVGKKNFFDRSVILVFAAVVGFAASCAKESCLLIIMYQVGAILLDYALYRSRKETLRSISAEGGYFDIASVTELLGRPKAKKSALFTKFAPVTDMLLKAALIVGILYAVVMPLISEMTFIMSIRRGLMLIIAAAPASALISLPLCSETGVAYSTIYGSIIGDAEVLEKMSSVTTAVFDKDEVLADGAPKLSSISSPILDNGTFKALAAYIAYNSQLRIAAPIVSAYKGTVMPNYIESFTDIPGSGMEISIRGVQLCIMTKEIFDLRGIAIPESELRDGLTFYMAVAGKYAGRLSFKENVNPYARDLIADLGNDCGIKTVLISEDSENATAAFASAIGVDEFHYGCAADEKAEVVQDIKDALDAGELLVYVSSGSGELHSAADIDVRTDEDEEGDICMTAGMGLPSVYAISKQVLRRQKINLIAILVLKLILIILALTGSATMWFIAFADMVLGSAAVLNAARDPRLVVGE